MEFFEKVKIFENMDDCKSWISTHAEIFNDCRIRMNNDKTIIVMYNVTS